MERKLRFADLASGFAGSAAAKDVDGLVRAIASSLCCEPFEISVVAPTAGSESRFKVTQAQLGRIRRGVVPFALFRMVETGHEMRSGLSLSRYNLPRNEDMQDEEVHVLVRTLRELRVEPTWKPDEPLGPSLEDQRLTFVNREAAVKKLQEVHLWEGKGTKRKVPLADNDHGFGKTEFALHYVDQCKKTLLSHSANITARHREVLTELSNCRTILIDGEPGQFVGKAPPNEVMNRALAEAITVKLEPGTAPSMTFTDSAKTFMSRIVKDLGPLFIVFDDIGPAFEDFTGQSVDSRELFFRFCKCVLAPWMTTPKVYFLLLGHSAFLCRIGERPFTNEGISSSPFFFVRLPLNLLGERQIEAILEETQVSRDSKRTLRQRWDLVFRSDVDEAVKLLLKASSGHPGTLLTLLIENPDFDRFRDCVRAGVDIVLTPAAKEELFQNVIYWQQTLAEWLGEKMDKHSCINLQVSVEDAGGRMIPAPLILDRCLLRWEGTLDKAVIYPHDTVREMLLAVRGPLGQYVDAVGKALECVSPDFPDVFEWLFIKRWRELFNEETTPNILLPRFFGWSTMFNNFQRCSSSPVESFPKLVGDKKKTSHQQPRKSKRKAISLQSKTALQSEWPILMEHVIDELEGKGRRSLCFKPEKMSASSDILFFAHVSSQGSKRQKSTSEDFKRTLTVGLAVKNYYSTTVLGGPGIIEECKKFQAMFSKLDKNVKAKFGEMTNVLVVCATQYTKKVQETFGTHASTRFRLGCRDECPDISDVLLLNLSTKGMREQFFGFEGQPTRSKVIEQLIKKISPELERERERASCGG